MIHSATGLRRCRTIALLAGLLLIVSSGSIRSQTDYGPDSSAIKMKLEFSGEYLVPTRYSNKISTVSYHTFFWKKRFDKFSIHLSGGLSTTFAWGRIDEYITRDSGIERMNHQTAAFGFGPAIKAEHVIFKSRHFFISGEASGAVLLFQRAFPYGGSVYNFMFRTGPSVGWQLTKGSILKIGYRWMHVSNGKGIGPQNPYYEGQGLNVAFLLLK